MARYGDGWVTEFVNSATFTTPARKAAATSQLKAMVALLNERAGDIGPEPPRPATSIFAEPGWFAVRYDALESPAALAAVGIKWIAATLSHGANADGTHNNDADDITNQQWLGNQRDAPYRHRGITVGGWGWHEVQPETEAVIAATHITNYRLDFWIANGEDVWKPDSERFVTNGPARYAGALATKVPASFPVAWSVLGAAAGQNTFGYDYRAFTSRGWRILPQAYPQQSPEYELSSCIDHAVRAGIPLELVHPTIANYGPQKQGAFKPTIAEWAAQLRAARARGVTGVSFWAHDWTVAQVGELVRAASG